MTRFCLSTRRITIASALLLLTGGSAVAGPSALQNACFAPSALAGVAGEEAAAKGNHSFDRPEKLGDFKPAYKGQMELYLRWLDQHERREGEESPLGLILCAGKKEETIRLLDMEGSGIRVAAYWTEALPREQLQRKLREAVALARQRLAASKPERELPADGDR